MDKEYLYREYLASERKQRALVDKAAHKALDIPHDDDVQIHASRTQTGLGWRELAIIVAGILGAGGVGAYWMHSLAPSPPAVVAPAAHPAPEVEGKARVRVFWGDREIQPGASEEATLRASD